MKRKKKTFLIEQHMDINLVNELDGIFSSSSLFSLCMSFFYNTNKRNSILSFDDIMETIHFLNTILLFFNFNIDEY